LSAAGAGKSEISAYLIGLDDARGAQERVSGVDLMSSLMSDLIGSRYAMSLHRRMERQRVECTRSLRRFADLILAATERSLKRAFNRDGSLLPVPVRTDQRRFRRYRPHD
jgi:hypothetical protein